MFINIIQTPVYGPNDAIYAKLKKNEENKLTINQTEFQRLTNAILEGKTVFIKDRQIVPSVKIYPKYNYTGKQIEHPDELPKALKQMLPLQKDTIRIWNDKIKNYIYNYIEKRTKYIQNLDVRNQIYKDIQKLANRLNITAWSPCKKTFWEANAEIKFENITAAHPYLKNWTTEQLQKYIDEHAAKWDITLPSFYVYHSSRLAVIDKNIIENDKDSSDFGNIREEYYDEFGNKRKNHHGFTQEIEFILSTKTNFSETDLQTHKQKARTSKDLRTAFSPSNIPEQWMVDAIPTPKKFLQEAVIQIKYFESLPETDQNEFISQSYIRCPNCKTISRKQTENNTVICENCGNILEEFVTTDNEKLLYGNGNYSDFEDLAEFVQAALQAQENEETEEML